MNRFRWMPRAVIFVAAVLLATAATAQGPRAAIDDEPSIRSALLAHFAQIDEEPEPDTGPPPFELPGRDEEAFEEEGPQEERRLVPEEYRTQPNEEGDLEQPGPQEGSTAEETAEEFIAVENPVYPWGEGPYQEAAVMGDACPKCGFRACVCPPSWFGSAEFNYLQRQRSRDIFLTRDVAEAFVANIGGVGVIVIPRVMETDSDKFAFEPGMRVTIGRYLGSDFIHRRHSVEFEYFGLQEWGAGYTVTGSTFQYTMGNVADFQVPNLIPNTFLQSGSLQSLFPSSVGGFNRADVQAFDYGSELHNFELNYRVRRGAERDRLVYRSDGFWQPQAAPSWRVSILGGFRALLLDEDFSYRARGRSILGVDFPPIPPVVIPGTEMDISGDLDIQTWNRLFGLQTGGDARLQFRRLSLAARGKVGLYANFAEQRSALRVVDRPDLFLTPNRVGEFDDTSLAFIGEVGVEARYRLTPAFALRFAYDFMWVTGVALASEQIEFTTIQEPNVNDNGAILIQGMSAGFEFAW